MNKSQVEQVETQIEISIEAAKDTIAKSERLERLYNNQDFKDIILEGYFKDEAVRLVGLIEDPAMEDDQEGLKRSMIGVSALRRHFMVIHQMANQMRSTLAASEEELENLRSMED